VKRFLAATPLRFIDFDVTRVVTKASHEDNRKPIELES